MSQKTPSLLIVFISFVSPVLSDKSKKTVFVLPAANQPVKMISCTYPDKID